MRRDGQQRRSARLSHASLKSISSISSVSSSVLNDIIPKRQAHAQADMGGQTNRLSIQLLSSARSSRTSDGLSILERGSIAGEIPHPIGLSSPSKRRVQSLQRRTLSRDTSGNVISVRVDCQPVDRDRIVGDSSRISIGTLGGRRQSHPLPAHVLTYNADEQRSPDQSSPTGRVPATPPSTPEDAIPNHQALLRHGSNASYASAASSATHEVTPLSASWTMALRDVAGNRRDYSPSTPSLQRSPIKPHSGQSLDFWDPSIQIQSKRPISAFKGSSLRSTVHKRRKCVRISSQAPTIHHALPAPPSSEKSLASPKSPRPEASPEGATSLEGRPLPRPPSINTFDPVFAASPPHPSLSFMETRQMVNPSGAPASPRHHHYHSSPALLRTSQDELTAARETLIRRSSTTSSVLSSPPLSRRDSPLSLSPGFLAVFPAVPRRG
ncbi:MAG: hypothetical protein M1838_005873 [Thelocarpon superellum]|nr:MAG: hypothetical protein M1838_005873 [Thelocarpon superellum]